MSAYLEGMLARTGLQNKNPYQRDSLEGIHWDMGYQAEKRRELMELDLDRIDEAYDDSFNEV